MNNINKDKGYVYNFFFSVNIVLNLLYDKYYVEKGDLNLNGKSV